MAIRAKCFKGVSLEDLTRDVDSFLLGNMIAQNDIVGDFSWRYCLEECVEGVTEPNIFPYQGILLYDDRK